MLDDLAGLDAAFFAPLASVALRAATVDEPDLDLAFALAPVLAPAFEAVLTVFLADVFAFTPALTRTLAAAFGLEAFLCVAVRPEQCADLAAKGDAPFAGAFYAPPDPLREAPHGVYGDAPAATAAAGEEVLALAGERLAAFVRAFAAEG